MGHNIKSVSVGYIEIETPPLAHRHGDSTVMYASGPQLVRSYSRCVFIQIYYEELLELAKNCQDS
jgi:hypothetical protein